MSFTELPFVILLAITVLLWLLLRRQYWPKLFMLLIASLLFYSHNRWWLIALIGAYCIADYLIALWIQRIPRRRLALFLGIAFNLSVMAFWKYTPVILRTAAAVTGWIGLPIPPQAPDDWTIPMGVSFYSFTGIAYLVDVHRGHIPAEKNFLRFCLFVTFFAHLVAGPILRAREFLDNIQIQTFPEKSDARLEATFLVGRGYFKKMVLADRIGLAIDPFFAHVTDISTAGVWSLPYVYLYALQIYFDFSGYTDIARGLALWFGFRWPENFARPYLASSIQDFWRRWHITLSAFLRDYLYIPLGGNRKGKVFTLVNLMLTMLLGGLWHGPSWSFMLWGGLQGLYLIIYKLWAATPIRRKLAELRGVRGRIYRIIAILITFHMVCLAWCFFRLTAFSDSLTCVVKGFSFEKHKMFVAGSADASVWLLLGQYAIAVLTIALVTKAGPLTRVLGQARNRPFLHGLSWGAALALLVIAVLLSPGGEKQPFIYFQF